MNFMNVMEGQRPNVVAALSVVAPALNSSRLQGKIRADSTLFKLHYKLTFALLLGYTALVTSYEFIDSEGSAIQCMVDEDVGVDMELINKYCFISSTFSLPRHFDGQVGVDVIHPGVGPQNEGDDRVYHAYYQWVPFLLVFQAGCFYAPHLIWKNIENGRTKALLKGVRGFADGASKERLAILAKFLCDLDKKSGYGDKLHLKFVTCELLNLVNTILQLFLTDRFLGNVFFSLGLNTLWLPWDSPGARNDSMSLVFPRMTKCDFRRFGPSGSIEHFDVLCVLPMNIVHEKIFIILFFHYFILILITSFMLIMRLVEGQGSAGTRARLLSLRKYALLDPSFPYEEIRIVVRKMRHGQFFLLKAIAKNLDCEKFAWLVANMAEIKRERDSRSHLHRSPSVRHCNGTGGLVHHSVV